MRFLDWIRSLLNGETRDATRIVDPPIKVGVISGEKVELKGSPISPYVENKEIFFGAGTNYYVPPGLIYPELRVSQDISGELMEAHNAKRGGFKPLRSNPFLILAAARHANWMAIQSTLGHYGFGDGDHVGRIAATSITGTDWDVSRSSENVGWNYATSREAVARWMASPGHMSNILDREFTDFGGYVVRGDRGNFWCCVFGKRVR